MDSSTHAKEKSHASKVYDIISIIVLSVSVLAPQIYLGLNPQVSLGWKYFVAGVALPIVLALLTFGVKRKFILLFAFLAYIWAVTEDAPLYLDSIFTWPEVTSGLQHTFLEILFHVLTALFMFLVVRQALRQSNRIMQLHHENHGKARISSSSLLLSSLLAFFAFILSYSQNIPLAEIEALARNSWYMLDFIEHLFSIIFLYL